jgi:hypothetical protein
VTVGEAGSNFAAELLSSPSQVRGAKLAVVGKTVKLSVRAGKLSFSVKLNKKGRAALKKRHKLKLTLLAVVVPPGPGSAAEVHKKVTLRR